MAIDIVIIFIISVVAVIVLIIIIIPAKLTICKVLNIDSIMINIYHNKKSKYRKNFSKFDLGINKPNSSSKT